MLMIFPLRWLFLRCQNHRSTLIKESHKFWGGSTVSAPAGGVRISKLFDSRIKGLHGQKTLAVMLIAGVLALRRCLPEVEPHFSAQSPGRSCRSNETRR